MSDFEVKEQNVVLEDKRPGTNEDKIMELNGLKYKMPQILSTTITRSLIKQYSQRQSYSEGGTIIFDMNTGDNYIDPHDCCLKLEVQMVGTNADWTSALPEIGAYALFNEIRIFAKSGAELDRIQDVNQYIHITHPFTATTDSIAKYGTLTGKGVAVNNNLNGNWSTFILPLSKLSGLFNPDVKNQKLPPNIISGARIELVLESFVRAFISTENQENTSFNIRNPQILMMANRLNDLTQRVLNQEASQSGLEYTYPRVFSASEASASSTQSIQVKKAVSQCKRVITCAKLSTLVNLSTTDSFKTTYHPANNKFVDFQYRVGSFYNPQQKSTSNSEHLFITMSSYNNHMNNLDAKAIDLNKYLTDYYSVGVSFESNILLNRSGIPINNSNTLEFQATVLNTAEHRYYVFMSYTSVIKARISNLQVKI